MYVIGYGLHRFDAEKSGKMWLLLMAYAMLSVINMLITDYLPDRFGGYNNPFVVAKSVVVFCIFLRVHFQSKTVNRIAACVFPCYLLQDGAAGFSFMMCNTACGNPCKILSVIWASSSFVLYAFLPWQCF